MPAKKVAAVTKPASTKKPAARADLGAPTAAYFAKQPEPQKAILAALKTMIEAAAPTATAALKWGMPLYEIDGEMMCAVRSHKAHVALILSGPESTFVDPAGRLEGDGKTGRHLKLRAVAEIPKADVKRWLAAAAKLSKSKS